MGDRVLGKIESTMLGYEDHGIFTFLLFFNLEHCHQGFGGYSLGGDFTDEVIQGILKATGREKWEDLVGAICWCEYDGDVFGGTIRSIEAPDFIPHEGKFTLRK